MENSVRSGVGLLLVRAVVGVVFLAHGLDKAKDVGAVEQNFDGLGIPLPSLMAPFVTGVEIVGGVLLIAGLFVPLAGLALAIDMVVAFATVHAGKGFFVADGGYELVMLLGVASAGVAIAGAGAFSLDNAMNLRERLMARRSTPRGRQVGSPTTQ